MAKPSSETPPTTENASVASRSFSTQSSNSSQARFTLASDVPNLGGLELVSHFHDLSPLDRDTLANIVWVTMHLTNGQERYIWPHSKDVLDEFVSELNKATEARHITVMAQLRNTEKTSSLDPPPAAVDSTSCSSLTVPTLHFRQPRPSLSVDYSVMIPVRTASITFGVDALRPEIREYILSRAGYAPLSVLTKSSTRYVATNPGALNFEHVITQMPNGELEETWIPVLTEFIEVETNLDRSEWAEAVRNLLELFNRGCGASHCLTLMWTDYFNTLLSHYLFESEQDFHSILRFDIQTRKLWWSGSEPPVFPTNVLEGLSSVHMQMFQEEIRSIIASSMASSSRSSYVPRPSSYHRDPFPRRPRNYQSNQSKPYNRHIASGGSSRETDSVCILCARPDHRAIDCRESNNVSGGLVVSEWASRHIHAKDDKRPICFNFNFGRFEPSHTVRHHSHQCSHRCSLCLGSHSAVSCHWRHGSQSNSSTTHTWFFDQCLSFKLRMPGWELERPPTCMLLGRLCTMGAGRDLLERPIAYWIGGLLEEAYKNEDLLYYNIR